MKKTLVYSILIAIIDQIIKKIVIANITFNSSIVIIKDFFNVTLVKNTGAAFSILSNNTTLLIIFNFLILLYILKEFIYKRKLQLIETICFSLLLGGIIGNLIDRVFLFGVIDYLDFNIFNYRFPIFNLADICICIGAFILGIIVLTKEVEDGNNSRKFRK